MSEDNDNDNDILADAARERFIDKIYAAKVAKLTTNQHIKRSTIATHLKRILHLQLLITGRKNVDDLSFLKKAQKVILFIEGHYSKDNSRQAYLLSIGSVLKEMTEYNIAYHIYHAHSARLALKITAQLLQQKQSFSEFEIFNKIRSIILK